MSGTITNRTESTPIALTVLGGFLGAGKTTLVNHVLQHSNAERIAVLVNDFGAIDIDARLIVARRSNTVSLANGCVCCSIGGDLTRALLDISRWEERPEQLIIEASGVANPAKIAAFGRVGRSFSLHGVIVMVDAENVVKHWRDPRLADTITAQLNAAHLLVINKCDRVSAADRVDLKWQLQPFAGTTGVVETEQARLPITLLLSRLSDAERSDAAEAASMEDDADHRAHFATWVYRSDRPFRRSALEQVLAETQGLLRAKGSLHLAESADRRYLLQSVGPHISLSPIDLPDDAAEAGCELVFIGLRDLVDPEDCRARLVDAH